jgi:hypothetical protein
MEGGLHSGSMLAWRLARRLNLGQLICIGGGSGLGGFDLRCGKMRDNGKDPQRYHLRAVFRNIEGQIAKGLALESAI